MSLATTQASDRRWLIIGFHKKTHDYSGLQNPDLRQDDLERLAAEYTDPCVELRYEVVDYRNGSVGKLEILRDPKTVPYQEHTPCPHELDMLCSFELSLEDAARGKSRMSAIGISTPTTSHLSQQDEARAEERITGEHMKDLTIREAYESESEALRHLTLAAYEEYAALMPPHFWARYRQILLATLDEHELRQRLVAIHDHHIVGSVLLYPNAGQAYGRTMANMDWPEVRLLAVLPTARGQGIGLALMNECVQHARAFGAMILGLHTMDFMRSAQRLYERMGFVHTPEFDMRPSEEVVIKGYQLLLDKTMEE